MKNMMQLAKLLRHVEPHMDLADMYTCCISPASADDGPVVQVGGWLRGEQFLGSLPGRGRKEGDLVALCTQPCMDLAGMYTCCSSAADAEDGPVVQVGGWAVGGCLVKYLGAGSSWSPCCRYPWYRPSLWLLLCPSPLLHAMIGCN